MGAFPGSVNFTYSTDKESPVPDQEKELGDPGTRIQIPVFNVDLCFEELSDRLENDHSTIDDLLEAVSDKSEDNESEELPNMLIRYIYNEAMFWSTEHELRFQVIEKETEETEE